MRGLYRFVVFCLPSLSPFLVFNGLDHPTVMAVPVATMKLVDGIGEGIVSVDWIGTDLLFFSSIQLVPDV
jgi:hypothetical protein